MTVLGGDGVTHSDQTAAYVEVRFHSPEAAVVGVPYATALPDLGMQESAFQELGLKIYGR